VRFEESQMKHPVPEWLSRNPGPKLLDPNWKYIPAAATDILARFRAMGWVPPSEAKREKRS